LKGKEEVTNIVKINFSLYDGKIMNILLMEFKQKINVIGVYDLNKDNLVDILYLDEMNNVNYFNK
jgi:hypothetical protein